MAARVKHATFALVLMAAGSAIAQELAPPQSRSACIAIVLPSVQGVDGDGTTVASSLRDLFSSFLRGPSMHVVLLESRLASHAIEEARQKDCPHVLTVTLTRKASAGGGNVFGKVVGQAGTSAVWGLPMGGVGGAVVRGATTATTQAIAELASSTRARDEVRLDYSLTSLGGRPEFGPRTDKAKAKTDGEDLLTPMVERGAEAIVAAAK
jgi:hypothetical protein